MSNKKELKGILQKNSMKKQKKKKLYGLLLKMC